MKRFPDPVLPPHEVREARRNRVSELIRSSAQGVGIRLLIVIVELIAVLFVGSSALFMDALSTFIDISSSLFLILCFRLADKPPDRNHPFGHGRFEPLAGLQLGIFLFILGLGMGIYQLSSATHPEENFINPYLWTIPLIAALLLEGSYQVLMRTAKKKHSPALQADALHYRIDSLSSLFATVALILAASFPSLGAVIDHIGAAIISLFMIFVGMGAIKNNVNQLLDRIPDKKFFEKVKKAALRVNGVRGTEKIRIQMYGPDAHVDIDIEVDPELSVDKAHKISQKTRVEIQKEWPFVRDVTVHIEPYYPGDH